MRIFILLLALACAPVLGLADPSIDVSQARNYTIDTLAKKVCIAHWSQPDNAAAMAPFASISEHCSCIQDEMRYTVSDELAVKSFRSLLEGTPKQSGPLLSAGEREWVSDSFGRLYVAAEKSCREKVVRRNNGR